MTQNINRAISFANGYYLCCIGDDDTIMPSCVTYLDEFKKKGVDIISPKITINYSGLIFQVDILNMLINQDYIIDFPNHM